MLPHPETARMLSALQFPERRAAGAEAGARSRPPRFGSTHLSPVGWRLALLVGIAAVALGIGSAGAARAEVNRVRNAVATGGAWDETSGEGSVEVGCAASPDSLATPAASPVAVPPLFQAWLNAYIVEDPDAFATLYTLDGRYEDVPSGQTAQGREAIAALAAGFFTYQDNYAFAPLAFFQGDGWALLEVNSSATDAETGQRVTGVRIATVFELDGGLIRRSSDYYDLAGILAQLGAFPDEGTPLAGTPTP